MKILLKSDPSNSRVIEGLHNAAYDCGMTSLIWDESRKPSFDMVQEFEPDLVICVDCVEGQPIHSACQEKSIKLVSISPTKASADSLNHIHKSSADLIKCNHDKTKNLDIITISEKDNRQILKLLKLGLKCFSYENKLNTPCYLGLVTPQESHSLLCRAKMFFVFEEDWELICNCIASDCIPVLFNNTFGSGELPSLESQEEIELEIKKIQTEENYRLDTLAKCKELVFSGYTYHHRLSEIMTLVNRSDESKLVIEQMEKYK
jgi:hypothetical protein